MDNDTINDFLGSGARRRLDFLFDEFGNPAPTCRLPSCSARVTYKEGESRGRPKWFCGPACAQAHRRHLAYLTRECATLQESLNSGDLSDRKARRAQAVLNWLSAVHSMYASTPAVRNAPPSRGGKAKQPATTSLDARSDDLAWAIRSALRAHQDELDELQTAAWQQARDSVDALGARQRHHRLTGPPPPADGQ